MNSNKNMIKAGTILSILSLALLIYNFFNMYSLPGKCPEDVDLHPCQAYDNWQLINQIGLVFIVVGIIILAIGFIKQQRKN